MAQKPQIIDTKPIHIRNTKLSVEQCLRALGLDVEYVRGEGDYLYYQNEEGEEVKVLDLVGGYGASLFGHNNTQLVGVLRRLLLEQRPFNAQGSIRPLANELKSRLSRMVQRETNREYAVVLDSTGSGAVEAAIKHAELEFQMRLNSTLDRLHKIQKKIRMVGPKGSIEVPDDTMDIFQKTLGVSTNLSGEELVQSSIDHLNMIVDATPTVLALDGAFHGKSTGALSLTENLEYRAPWKRLGFSTTFISKDDTIALDAVIANACFPYVDVTLERNTLSAKAAKMVNVIAAFVEPIQGEGGVLEVGKDFLESLRSRSTESGFPLIFDEIQSGMGRTGTFLASTPSGVVSDYVLLSKALGGGISKVSALLVDRERYHTDFDMLHTSTFASDDHSSAVANKTLDLLEEDDGALMSRCGKMGEYFIDRIRVLKERYPGTIVGIRGRGLLMAVELVAREDTSSLFLQWASEQGLVGYMVAGYLLREHGIRMAPTLSNPNTLRIQPSAYVTHKELNKFCDAFDQALRLLQEDDFGNLVGHLVGRRQKRNKNIPVRSVRQLIKSAAQSNLRRVSFLAHLLEPQDAQGLDRSLNNYSPTECDRLLGRMSPLLSPFVLHRTSVSNASGSEIELSVIGVPFTSAQVMKAFRAGDGGQIRNNVFDAVELARAEGAQVIGFGGYTSIVTNSCLDVVEERALVTSGNSVTAGAAIEATMQRVGELGITNRRLGVVGAAGNLGCVIAELMAASMTSVLLVGRRGAEKRLQRRAKQISWALGDKCPRIDITTEMSDLATCGVIMTATNAPKPVIYPQHLSMQPTLICDIATPGDVDSSVFEMRHNAVILKGGLVSLPSTQKLVIPGMFPPPGQIYGCLAETILLGLDNASVSPSVGLLTPKGILSSMEMVRRHGFGLDPWHKAIPMKKSKKPNQATDFIAA